MFTNPAGGCMGHLGASGVDKFCAALQQLFDEHSPLRSQMEQLLLKAKQLAAGKEGELGPGLQELIRMETKFKYELDIHSDKEEKGLFPILGRHIGTQVGPIAVMEYEHSEAKNNLAAFEKLAGAAGDRVAREDAERITTPLITAIHILMEHFLKEENVLFPMAERVLSPDEKEELLEIVQVNS